MNKILLGFIKYNFAFCSLVECEIATQQIFQLQTLLKKRLVYFRIRFIRKLNHGLKWKNKTESFAWKLIAGNFASGIKLLSPRREKSTFNDAIIVNFRL